MAGLPTIRLAGVSSKRARILSITGAERPDPGIAERTAAVTLGICPDRDSAGRGGKEVTGLERNRGSARPPRRPPEGQK